MCCGLICRCVMYGITIFLGFAGASIMAVGSALTADFTDYMSNIFDLAGDTIDSDLYVTSISIMIAIGVLLIAAAFFGCWGTWRQRTGCLTIFNILVIAISALIITSGILATVYKNSLDKGSLEDRFLTQVQDEYSVDDDVTNSWDRMQEESDCCGSTGPSDYENSQFVENTNYTIPATCCVSYSNDFEDSDQYDVCLENIDNDDFVHQQGCADAFEDDVSSDADIVMGVCFSLGIVSLIAIIFSCCIKGRLEEENNAV